MQRGFWKMLKKPIVVLAPMADVTDQAFRRVIAKYGKPDVLWTEFVSTDGLFLGGREALMPDLAFTEEERPIVAQFFTSNPERMEKAAALAAELGFDGVDINMGCPDRTIEKQGAGAALIKNPALAQELIAAAVQGAGMLPVSVKTRVGYNRVELESWLPHILKMKPAALTVHARTRKEMSLVPARWEHVGETVLLRNELSPETLILGNGDVKDLSDARARIMQTGADGAMLGRAIFGNPWLYTEKQPSLEEKLRVMVEHTKLYEELLGGKKSFAVMKKHYKAYVNNFDGAKELRMELMEAKDAAEVERITESWLSVNGRILTEA
jgi:nifR3 family TIM-barrel protein